MMMFLHFFAKKNDVFELDFLFEENIIFLHSSFDLFLNRV